MNDNLNDNEVNELMSELGKAIHIVAVGYVRGMLGISDAQCALVIYSEELTEDDKPFMVLDGGMSHTKIAKDLMTLTSSGDYLKNPINPLKH